MGIKEERDEMMGGTRNELRTSVQRGGMGGNGMRDVWVIGEGFFRGVGAVFDVSSMDRRLNNGDLANTTSYSCTSRGLDFEHTRVHRC